jgi:hypothetical protein
MMEGNLWKAVDADGSYSTSNSDRGVAYHLTIIPWPSTHMPWQHELRVIGIDSGKQIHRGYGHSESDRSQHVQLGDRLQVYATTK